MVGGRIESTTLQSSDLRHNIRHILQASNKENILKTCGWRPRRIDYSTSIRFTSQTSDTFYKHPTRRVFKKLWPEATSNRLLYKHQIYVTNIRYTLQASNKESISNQNRIPSKIIHGSSYKIFFIKTAYFPIK